MADRHDEADYLRRKAAQFRRLAAEQPPSLSLTMVEMANALEAHAASIERHREPAREPDPLYRVYFRTSFGNIAARDDFTAENDWSALVIASELCDACSDICVSFELWQGLRRVDKEERRRPALTAAQISRRTQETVVQREMTMRDSEWLVAKSKRLAERLRQLTDGRGAGA